jgi:hypothetical protein
MLFIAPTLHDPKHWLLIMRLSLAALVVSTADVGLISFHDARKQ